MAQPKRHYQPGKTPAADPSVKPGVGSATVLNKKVIVARQPLGSLFTKDNYLWMGIGAAVIILGMLLMMGGKNENPGTFNYDVVYSTQRITVAPILILLGLLIEVYAIFKTPKAGVVTKE